MPREPTCRLPLRASFIAIRPSVYSMIMTPTNTRPQHCSHAPIPTKGHSRPQVRTKHIIDGSDKSTFS